MPWSSFIVFAGNPVPASGCLSKPAVRRTLNDPEATGIHDNMHVVRFAAAA
jgi:hypothetical protein